MRSTCIIFVLVASVLRGTRGLTTAVPGKLPAEALATLDQIKQDEDATIFLEFALNRPIFDLLSNLTTAIINDAQAPSLDKAAVDAVKQTAFSAFDYSLNAIGVAAGGNCPNLETVRSKAHTNLGEGLQAIFDAVGLAQTGNYPANLADIEAYGKKAKAGFAPFWYSSIEECLNPTSRADVRNLIQMAKDGSTSGLDNSVDAIVGAIEVYAAMVSDKSFYEGKTALVKIDSFRLLGFRSLLADIAYYFAIIDALYINLYLGQTSIVSELYVTRLNMKLVNYEATEAMQLIFTSIVDVLEKNSGVIEEDLTSYYPVINATEANDKALFDGIFQNIFQTITITQPKSAAEVAKYERSSTHPSSTIVSTFYTALKRIQKTEKEYDTNVAYIESANATQNKISADVISEIFHLMSANNTCTKHARQSEVKHLLAETISLSENENKAIYNALKFLYQILFSKKSVTQSDYVTIRDYQKQAITFVTGLFSGIFDENLGEVLASSGY